MLLRRVICTTVVLFSLSLLHWPQFAHSDVIFEDNRLNISKGSNATYDPKKGVLTINDGSAIYLTLAASEPVLSIAMKIDAGAPSTVKISSANFSQARCTWEITTRKAQDCTMDFTVNRGDAKSVLYQSRGSIEFASVRVGMPPNEKPQINVEKMDPVGRDPKAAEQEVLDSLKKCTEILPKFYNQSIQNSTQQNRSNVTYVWKIAVEKVGSAQVVLLLRDMTLVRFDPDPPTTEAPNTTTTLANTTPAQGSATTQPGSDEPLSAGVIGGIAGGGVALLVVVIGAIVIAVVCVRRRRAQTADTNTVEEQPQPAVEKEPQNAKSEDHVECSVRSQKKQETKPERPEPTVIRVDRKTSLRVSIRGSKDTVSLDTVANPADLKDIKKAEEPKSATKKA